MLLICLYKDMIIAKTTVEYFVECITWIIGYNWKKDKGPVAFFYCDVPTLQRHISKA